MNGFCKVCARLLKLKYVPGDREHPGPPVAVHVCRSPICKMYGKPQ